ncbi:MAG: sn-glycerol-3-phosphate ABC transporter ATP-binding protein UgpC [Geminicoccaceae bacterium]|nr:MAG: sn-glycerol-3-phosphate ABC transporter ATP-binding protein UgpC [Geminicoccaceae bacterium]
MSFLELDQVEKSFGQTRVINGVSLGAEQGEFVVFVGPSGCGKSTLLRMIAGLEEVSAGKVRIDGKDVTHKEPAARQVSMVFQSYALYPHMSVFQNMAFGLEMARTPRAEIERRVAEAARILQIEALMQRKPRELSGGQRQRVAIGRAIVRQPKLFLFDEPLSNLDAELRSQMRVEISLLHRKLGATMVYVTHDQIEAMTLADRIVVLRNGNVEQFATPSDVYDHPANVFVAGFMGSPKMNFVQAKVADVTPEWMTVAHPAFTDGKLVVPTKGRRPVPAGEPVTVGLRPEHLELGRSEAGLELQVDFAENLGGTSQVYTRLPDGTLMVILVQGRPALAQGDQFHVTVTPDHVYLFDHQGVAL